MKFNYEYKVQMIDPKGMATVEYYVHYLGSVTRVFFIPWSLGKKAVVRVIKDNFPVQMFFSRHQSISPNIPDEIRNLKGSSSLELRDYYFDMDYEEVETAVISDEKKDTQD